MKLVQLPSGDWVDPSWIVQIFVAERTDGEFASLLGIAITPERVIVVMRDGQRHLCFCETGSAPAMRDKIAAMVNQEVRDAD